MTVNLQFVLQAIGYVGLVFGIGMGYQRLVDRIANADSQIQNLNKELRRMRDHIYRIGTKLMVNLPEDDDK